MFRTRGKHSVGFPNVLGDQIINQYTDVGLRSIQDQRILIFDFQAGIDTRHQPLCPRFFVTGSAV